MMVTFSEVLNGARYSFASSRTLSQSLGVSPIRYIFTVYGSLRSILEYISGVAVMVPSPTAAGRLSSEAAALSAASVPAALSAVVSAPALL